ncbi:MAG: L-ribulose-5-phosphate 4-epimerase [Erysipelotrichaceae bacterium]|nr:L-ribulose-5-phosphate 4-epimerase [Erysipelotrichaceae bacterium]
MLEELKKKVYEANEMLVEYGLVTFTWGNVSEITPDRKYIVIKPSGVDYKTMKPEDMVVTDMDGNIVEGDLKPSSDLPTHLVIYRNFKNAGGVVHTHSTMAVAYAQARRDIIPLGTTHADTFYGNIPCTRLMTPEEIGGHYEKETGNVIVEEFDRRGINPDEIPGVIVANHGPFTWGKDGKDAVEHSVILEEVAKMNYYAETLNQNIEPMQKELLDKHYLRKHGANAYYGQKK